MSFGTRCLSFLSLRSCIDSVIDGVAAPAGFALLTGS